MCPYALEIAQSIKRGTVPKFKIRKIQKKVPRETKVPFVLSVSEKQQIAKNLLTIEKMVVIINHKLIEPLFKNLN